MTLYIKEIAWGIDRKNGGKSERVTAEKEFPCVVGALPTFPAGRRNFSIDEVGADYILLTVHYENNPAANKSWTLKAGSTQTYLPRSFDGGYKYEFKLQ